jgi:hypothetical protein
MVETKTIITIISTITATPPCSAAAAAATTTSNNHCTIGRVAKTSNHVMCDDITAHTGQRK